MCFLCCRTPAWILVPLTLKGIITAVDHRCPPNICSWSHSLIPGTHRPVGKECIPYDRKGVSAISQIGRYTLSYQRGRYVLLTPVIHLSPWHGKLSRRRSSDDLLTFNHLLIIASSVKVLLFIPESLTHETSTQCWFNVVSASLTMWQH